MTRRVKDILRARQKRKEYDFDYGEPLLLLAKDEQIQKLWQEEVHGRPSKKKKLPPLVRKFRLRKV